MLDWSDAFSAFGKAKSGKPEAAPKRGAQQDAKAASDPARPEPAAKSSTVEGPWSPDRLTMLTALWGDGFIGPGGEDEALRLAKPLGLTASHSVLHLGAGMGTGQRAIAKASGAWVTGYEADAALVAMATEAAQRHGMAKKAPINRLDPAAPGFRPNYFHHALSQEALWTVEDANKDKVLAGMVQAVKIGGNLMLTDLVRAANDPTDAAWSAWAVLERGQPHMPTEAEMGKRLARLGLDIRIVEDVSNRQIGQALTGWMGMLTGLRAHRPPPRQAAHLVREAELWLRRVRLMQEGRIRLLRWHAIRVK